jgi:hypothetical protein
LDDLRFLRELANAESLRAAKAGRGKHDSLILDYYGVGTMFNQLIKL